MSGAHEQMNENMIHIHNRILFSLKNDIVLFVTKWMKQILFYVKKVKHRKMNTACPVSYIVVFKKIDLHVK